MRMSDINCKKSQQVTILKNKLTAKFTRLNGYTADFGEFLMDMYEQHKLERNQ